MSRQPVEVRRARCDDVEDVLRLWAQARDEHTSFGRSLPPVEQVRPRLLHALEGDDIELLLARMDGVPAGFAVLRVAPAGPLAELPALQALHLDHLFVEPGSRRRGVAHALLGGVLARADRRGADQIYSSVTPWAKETHRFFARLGFVPVVVRRSVPTSTLRRRLAGEAGTRPALGDLLSRRRTLRARTRPAEVPVLGPPEADELAVLPEVEPQTVVTLDPAIDPVAPPVRPAHT